MQHSLAVQVARAVGSPGSAVLIFVPGMASILAIMDLFELISSADVTYKVRAGSHRVGLSHCTIVLHYCAVPYSTVVYCVLHFTHCATVVFLDVLPCPVLSRPVVSCFVVSCHVLSCPYAAPPSRFIMSWIHRFSREKTLTRSPSLLRNPPRPLSPSLRACPLDALLNNTQRFKYIPRPLFCC